jgi:hypothetical protein
MTTMADMKYAGQLFRDHTAAHKCKAMECEERKRLWLRYMSVAERWGLP